jgi:hypothetical protein
VGFSKTLKTAMTVVITREDLSAADLRQAAARTQEAKVARRMLAIALVLEGCSRAEAAQTCAMDRQTLRDWVHRYNASGPDGLSDQPRRNGPLPRLSAEQQAEVAVWVHQHVAILDDARFAFDPHFAGFFGPPARLVRRRSSPTKRISYFVAHLEQIDALYGPMPGRASKPVVLVVDNGPIHVSKLSRAALAARAHWLDRRMVAEYAPELNDFELVYCHPQGG